MRGMIDFWIVIDIPHTRQVKKKEEVLFDLPQIWLILSVRNDINEVHERATSPRCMC